MFVLYPQVQSLWLWSEGRCARGCRSWRETTHFSVRQSHTVHLYVCVCAVDLHLLLFLPFEMLLRSYQLKLNAVMRYMYMYLLQINILAGCCSIFYSVKCGMHVMLYTGYQCMAAWQWPRPDNNVAHHTTCIWWLVAIVLQFIKCDPQGVGMSL